jgi:hypothetical protein
MRLRKLNAEATALAARLQITEAAARNIITRCTEAGVDYTTFQPGQKLPKKSSVKDADTSDGKPVAALPADAGDDPIEAPPAEKPAEPKASPRSSRKAVTEYQTSDEMVELDGTMINATLTRKQKMALLAQAIKKTGDGALDPIELVRAINAHTELAGDSAEGSTFELHLYLDPTAPTPTQLAEAYTPSIQKDSK